MIGAESYGFNMLIKLSIISAAVVLGGCGVMPGMENLNTMPMRKSVELEHFNVHATLIPITPTLIANQHISTYYYHVAPADVLHINVWQHPEFILDPLVGDTHSPGVQGAAGLPGYLVNPQGQIYFPLIGYVHVANKTVDAIRSLISLRLRKYVPNPQVTVRVADFRGQKVYVLGEANKIGFLPLTDQQLTLADALSLSGWMNPDTADTKFIYVIRGTYNEPQIFWLDARTADKLLLAEHFSMQPQDILYVSTAPATRWNRVLNQLLPTIQGIWYTQAVVANA